MVLPARGCHLMTPIRLAQQWHVSTLSGWALRWSTKARDFDEGFIDSEVLDEDSEEESEQDAQGQDAAGAASVPTRGDPWPASCIPPKGSDRFLLGGNVPGWEWQTVQPHEVREHELRQRLAYDADQQRRVPLGIPNPADMPPYDAERPWQRLVPLPTGRLSRRVEARTPSMRETPKIEVITGDLNSMCHKLPGVRVMLEYVLRDFTVVLLPVLQKDAKPLKPPQDLWSRATLDALAVQKDWVDYAFDAGTQAFWLG